MKEIDEIRKTRLKNYLHYNYLNTQKKNKVRQ